MNREIAGKHLLGLRATLGLYRGKQIMGTRDDFSVITTDGCSPTVSELSTVSENEVQSII